MTVQSKECICRQINDNRIVWQSLPRLARECNVESSMSIAIDLNDLDAKGELPVFDIRRRRETCPKCMCVKSRMRLKRNWYTGLRVFAAS